MIRRPLFVMLLLLLLPGTLRAQAGPLRIHGDEDSSEIALAMHRGHPAHALRALEALGGRISADAAGAQVTLFGDTFRFEVHSPFFEAEGAVWQLAAPVYREGGVLYLPLQFFAEWLPERYPQRLRFDEGELRLTPPTQNTGAVAAAPSGVQRESPQGAPRTNSSSDVRVVILDPGHGGRDPGKIGPAGLREKDVVLAIAKRVAAHLESRDGYEVHLTRTTDTLPSLADRPRLANKWKAGRPSALFVSIHANAHHTQARGFETFFLSEARTEDERRVAEMENAAVAFEEPENSRPDDDLDWILNNLRNDFYLRASHDLASVVQDRIGPAHPGPNRGVKQAGFRVLVGAFMPAILVETAFITHQEEERLLGSSTFQDRLAGALADAIVDFFEDHEHLWTTTSDS